MALIIEEMWSSLIALYAWDNNQRGINVDEDSNVVALYVLALLGSYLFREIVFITWKSARCLYRKNKKTRLNKTGMVITNICLFSRIFTYSCDLCLIESLVQIVSINIRCLHSFYFFLC